jgi:hypothetical protein
VPAISGQGTDSRLVEIVDDHAPGNGTRYYRLVTPGM